MARIRTVKPEMAQSLTVAGWSLLAQMLWPRLFCHLDDEGRCVYDPRLLRANLAPLVDECTSDAMAAVVGEWQASGSVQVYTVDGRDYLQVCEWDKHQKINRPSESDHPPPEEADEDSPTVHGGLSEDSPPERKGTGNREQGTQGASADADDAPDDQAKTDEAFEQFWQAYPPTNGVMRDKKGARKQWAKLSWDERRAAYRGAKNKAAHFQATGEEPPYALRFLRRRDFMDYQEPVTVDKATGQVRTIDTTPTCVHCQQAVDAHDDGMCDNGRAEAA